MKATRLHLILAISIGLSAGSTVGLAAQSEDAVPVEFTGILHEVAGASDECGVGTSVETVDGVTQWRGYRCERWMGTSDPRFTGVFTSVANMDTYPAAEATPDRGPLNAWTVVRRVENDEGAWQGEPTTQAWFSGLLEGGLIDDPSDMVVFTGEGGYEGLTAVVEFTHPRVINSEVRGFIFRRPLPLAPSVVVE